MATITTKATGDVWDIVNKMTLKGIGVGVRVSSGWFNSMKNTSTFIITIPRMSSTRFNNVVKRVLEKNLTEQGITPISIKYSE